MPELEEQETIETSQTNDENTPPSDGAENQPTNETNVDHPIQVSNSTEESVDGDTPPDTSGRDLSKINFKSFQEARAGVKKDAPAKEAEANAGENKAPVRASNTQQPANTPANKPIASKSKDFTGIDEGDKIFFRDMSNDAFAKQKEIYLENRRLKAEIETVKKTPQQAAPNYYTGHPEAFTLTDDYRNTTGAISVANNVEQHLINQLELISRGEQWEGLTTDKDGNIFRTGTKSEPTERARWELEKQLRQVQDAKIGYERKLQDLSGNYSKSYNEDIAIIKSAEDKFFPDYDKEDHPTRKAQDAFINNILPASQRSNPLARVLAKTVANNSIFKTQLDAANKKIAELEAKLKNVSPAVNGQQPGKNKTVAGVEKSNGKISYSEMKRMRESGMV